MTKVATARAPFLMRSQSYYYIIPLPQEGDTPLGLSVAGGRGSPLGTIPLFISYLQPNGLAASTGLLRVSRGGLTPFTPMTTGFLRNDRLYIV